MYVYLKVAKRIDLKNFFSQGKKKTGPMYGDGWASQVALVVKNPPANAAEIRDAGSISESGRCPGGGRRNPPQYSCLENPIDRGAWQATVDTVRHA